MYMDKTATITITVDTEDKTRAEAVLKDMGISLSSAVELYLEQIALVGNIPFHTSLMDAPRSVNADAMTRDELVSKLERGIEAARSGRGVVAARAFEAHRAMRHHERDVLPYTERIP